MITHKITDFLDNDTNCDYVRYSWNKNIENDVEVLKSIVLSNNKPATITIPIDSLYIYHFTDFTSETQASSVMLRYDGKEWFISIYFIPTPIGHEVFNASDVNAEISFAVTESSINNAIKFFQMEYQSAIG